MRYVWGFAVLAIVSFVVFLLVPIRGPKPMVEHPTGMYWLLQLYDVPLNSLPSLHAGMVVFTLAFGNRIIGSDVGRGVKPLFALWGGLILYATLATKEHYVVDIVAGVALGLIVDRWTWSRGLAENTQQQGADVPGSRAQVMVRAADGVNLAREGEQVRQKDSAAVVGAERG
jgi:hypothetical protein